MPFASVAGQPGGLQRQNHSHLASAHGGQQPVIAGTHSPATRTPEVFIDYYDFAPPQLVRAIPESVLSALALEIMSNLTGRGLPDVDPGRARQVIRRDPRR